MSFGTSQMHTHVHIEFDTNFRFLLRKDLPRMQSDRQKQRRDEKQKKTFDPQKEWSLESSNHF